MPKSKEIVSSSESDSDSEVEKPKKKQKTSKKPEAKASSSQDKTAEDLMPLSKMRFVSVSDFRGKKFVNIREYYEKDGDMLPGRKGIALTPEQWDKLKGYSDAIDEALNSS